MSKRIIAVCLTLGVLVGANAFASRARTLVLGTGDPLGIMTDGALYYDDNYNVFYNPSYANDFKNWATVEKYNGSSASGLTGAEGGFVANFMNFNVGFYANRPGAVNNTNFGNRSGGNPTGQATNGTPYLVSVPVRPFDLIFAGDNGLKWGLDVSYASNSQPDVATKSVGAQDLTVRAGVQVGELEPFARFKIIGKEQQISTSNVTTTGDRKNQDWMLGTKYHWGEWVPYAVVQMLKVTPAEATGDDKLTRAGLGLGRSAKIGEGAHLHYALSYWKNGFGHYSRDLLPIDLSVEGDMTGWLTGRAGMTYALWDRTTGATNTANATTGRLGATIHVNKLDFDWAVGSTAGTENPDGQTFDLANGFFTAASLTYHW